ncbi:phosphate ABC transporter substrate-binding protein [Pelagibius litoralis]|uniref:Phosphate ABC transporter substrate-binding protein n=1 Tax=Pelagibius litoralis TaxID=374515 RepID=A0A967KEH7_9PROT|nr:substrate-binding domain-containing protein [Pelagibius litoralis]NIA71939.1 phosphate ABC transporter substrate-binding protein [Pelagibius litoralis]
MTVGWILKPRTGRYFWIGCLALTGLILAGGLAEAQADTRERIRIVGSGTVFPLAVAAAENFSVKAGFAAPLVEKNGTAEGFKLFCAGVGVEHPDVVTAERRASAAEVAACRQKGISLAEIKIGHQAIVLAKSRRGAALSLTPKQVLLAMAQQVPSNGSLAANPYRLWSDIDFSLPVTPIEVLSPPLTSPQRDAFTALMMAPAAATLPPLRGLESIAALRGDGAVTEVAADDVQAFARLDANPDALVILGFTFQQQNAGRLQPVAINGVVPSAASIADGSYGPVRALYFYIKREHLSVIPGLRDYPGELAGEAASGSDGYLVRRGLIPLPPAERGGLVEAAKRLTARQN